MNRTANARRLLREQTDEEKELWRALRAGRFVGFKFRRQHPLGAYYLDFHCPAAKLSVELDGFQHGMPKQRQHDEEREKLLATRGVEELLLESSAAHPCQIGTRGWMWLRWKDAYHGVLHGCPRSTSHSARAKRVRTCAGRDTAAAGP